MRRAGSVGQDDTHNQGDENNRDGDQLHERARAARELAEALQEESRALQAQARLQVERAQRISEVTARQADVLRLLALGYTRTEIAAALSISPRTVDTHRVRAMGRIGANNRADVVQWAISHQILSGV